MEVHRELVDLPDRARKIIAGRVAAGDPEDRFRLEVLAGLPETWLDADKIDQILSNLVENAVRHGAGIVTIVVEPAHIDGEEAKGHLHAVAVSVRDQGEGISPDVAPRVFRQFWRGKRRGGGGQRRHRSGAVHRQGPHRGTRRHDRCALRAWRRRRVSIYRARGDT